MIIKVGDKKVGRNKWEERDKRTRAERKRYQAREGQGKAARPRLEVAIKEKQIKRT